METKVYGALKGAAIDIGKAEDSLKEMEDSIREITSEILLLIKQGNIS